MTPDEVRMLDNRYALLFVRGERPVMDLKYDIMKHPNVEFTADGHGGEYQHGKKRYNYATIQFDRDLIDSDAEETKYEDDNSDYVILTEEDIEMILNPKQENETNETEDNSYEDDQNFDGSKKVTKLNHIPPHSGKS